MENSEGGGGSPGVEGETQAGGAEIVDSNGGMPEKQLMGAGGTEGAGATPPQDMTGRTDAPMDESGTTAGMELLSVQEEPWGLNRDNLCRVRTRKGGPKWVRKLSKMVETMAKNSAKGVPMGVITQGIWDVIMKLDKDGRRLEAKNKRQREPERKKKAKAKTKNRGKRERKRVKQESRKKSIQAETASSDESSSSNDSSHTTSSDLSSNSSSDTDDSCDTDRKSKSWDGGGRDGTPKPRRGRPEDFEFRLINGRKHVCTNKGTWQDCTNPPSTMQILWQPPLGVPECRVRMPLSWPSGPPCPGGGGGVVGKPRDSRA